MFVPSADTAAGADAGEDPASPAAYPSVLAQWMPSAPHPRSLGRWQDARWFLEVNGAAGYTSYTVVRSASA
eukprot:CAMPEP_0174936282 /NCGR_PEP_ID=MMETSP1355-20121228/56890_1 /TAXON_ID=464990 /ORGANISM="Hemiselmis tepida, Strain CCMP443" /LENGTH=70 /DNA_ID=CAMNT_0016183051 /DNA_START=313 /DNA_END=521 /DNA_ORIENTATION=+